jgi:hypothetical protein
MDRRSYFAARRRVRVGDVVLKTFTVFSLELKFQLARHPNDRAEIHTPANIFSTQAKG